MPKNLVLPSPPDIDKQVTRALKRPEVKRALKEYDGDPEKFRAGLKYEIERTNKDFYRLRKLANVVDGANRATIPIDAAMDYFNIMGGVGYAAKGIKDLAMAPGYLAYDTYYTAKTGDIIGGLVVNPAYEVLSWASLGALPHLLRHYSKQVDKKAVEEGSSRFLTRLKKNKSLEELADEPSTIKFPGREESERARRAA